MKSSEVAFTIPREGTNARAMEDEFFKTMTNPRLFPENKEVQIDYTGHTFWNDEDKGPYFKMGLYNGEPGWTGPSERTVFTDEYRLGDENSSFDEVAPGR